MSCSRCGKVLGAAAEILYSAEAEAICETCSGPGELGLRWGSPELARHLADRRAQQRTATARRRRALGAAAAATWILAGAFAAERVRSLPPTVTIDRPLSGTPIGPRTVVSGAVVASTVPGRLWLVTRSPGSRRWHAEQELAFANGEGAWQATVEIHGAKGARHRIGVAMADARASAAFQGGPDDGRSDDIPEWLRARQPEEQGGRGCRHRNTDEPELPAGATLLGSIDVTLAGGDDRDLAFDPCGRTFLGLGYDAIHRPITRTGLTAASPTHRRSR
jgi:hypothetical protein